MVLIAVLGVSIGIQAVPAFAQIITTLPAEEVCENPLISKDKKCRDNKLHLLAPLDDATFEMDVSDVPLETFFAYFNLSWPWLLGVASGIAVLQAVWGGVLIMTSMDRDGGKEKIEWAVGGMVIIALAGFILRFLNSIYYA